METIRGLLWIATASVLAFWVIDEAAHWFYSRHAKNRDRHHRSA